MTKIAINTGFGGFSLSDECLQELGLGDDFCVEDIERDDPKLIAAIEKLGTEASPEGDVEIIEIPDGVDWVICEYDGKEWIAEKHRTWGDRH